MHLPHLKITEDDENGLVLAIEGTELFDYVEEWLLSSAPTVYEAIDDVEMTPDFTHTKVYFSDEISQANLELALADIDPNKLEALFRGDSQSNS